MSDTPRTDQFVTVRKDDIGIGFETVPAHFCRALEAENALNLSLLGGEIELAESLIQERDKLKQQLSDEQFAREDITRKYHDLAVKNKQELDAALAEIQMFKKRLGAAEVSHCESIRLKTGEIEHLRKQAEGLCDGCGEQLDEALCLKCADKHRQERDQLLVTFRHTHVNNGVDDACKQCGLDLRNEIHQRAEQSQPVGDWGFKLGEEYPK